jgi:hypothetical protein
MKAFRYTFFGLFFGIAGENKFYVTLRNTAAHLAVRRRASNLRFELVASHFRQSSDAAFLIYQTFAAAMLTCLLRSLPLCGSIGN